MSVIGTIHEDVTTDVVGKIGSWQWLVTLVTTVLMAPSVFNQYEDIFLIHPTETICAPPEKYEVVNASLCYMTNGTIVTKCIKWNVKLMGIIWLRKYWLVFCDPPMRLLSTSIICRFGSMFGCVIYGIVADNFGRKRAITTDIVTSLGLELVMIFCGSEGWFRLLIFVKSIFGSATFYMGLLLICEISSNSWRSTLSTLVMSPRLFAVACMAVLANAAPNSETYSFIACMFGAGSLVLLKWCPESPQWLLHNRQIHVAEGILKNAAKVNGIELCSEFKIRPVNHRNGVLTIEDFQAYNCLDETTTCIEFLRIYNIRTTFLTLSSFWIFYVFLWSSLYVKVYKEENLTDLMLKILCGVVLLALLTIVLSKLAKLTLKRLLLVHIIITGAVTACVMFVEKGMLRSISSSIAISSGIIVHALLLNITPRLIATNMRGTVFGCCHATGQLGSIISYIILLFHPMADVTFSTVMAAVTVVVAGSCCLLPDVDVRELPDVIEDMDYYCELSKPMRWASQKTGSPSTEEVEIRVHSFGSARTGPSPSETRLPARSIGLGFYRTTRRAIGYFARVLRRK